MKRANFLPCLFLLAASQLDCKHSSPAGPGPVPLARIGVYVYFADRGVPDISVQLVQTGEVRVTDASGRTEFQVPAGEYVVRVYDLTRPGPSLPDDHEDHLVAVKRGESTLLKVWDCLPCL